MGQNDDGSQSNNTKSAPTNTDLIPSSYGFGKLTTQQDEHFASQTHELHSAIEQARSQIEENIHLLQIETERTRDEIKERATQFVEETKDRFDVERWIREHPWEIVGTAFFLGFYFGFRR